MSHFWGALQYICRIPRPDPPAPAGQYVCRIPRPDPPAPAGQYVCSIERAVKEKTHPMRAAGNNLWRRAAVFRAPGASSSTVLRPTGVHLFSQAIIVRCRQTLTATASIGSVAFLVFVLVRV